VSLITVLTKVAPMVVCCFCCL